MEPLLRICADCKICYGYVFTAESHYCDECDEGCLLAKRNLEQTHGLCHECLARALARIGK